MRQTVVLLGIAMLTGCAYHYSVNAPLTHSTDPSTGYRWATTTVPLRPDNETFVIVALSGGGKRAAALGNYILRELDAIRMPNGKTLLDQVGVISAVSGGTFTAMYYGLHGRAGFDDFEKQFLARDVQSMFLSRILFSPRNWMRSARGKFHPRTEIPVEVYDESLFHNQTFSDLLEQQRINSRPYVVLSSTELELGAPFEWTQDQFDVICSDISQEHVSRAVAASSAVPPFLTPIILKKYDPRTCGYKIPPWVYASTYNAYDMPSRQRNAVQLIGYLDSSRVYLHLVDGGVVDNTALRGPIQAITSTDTLLQPTSKATGFTLLPLLNLQKIKRLVVIAVSAASPSPADIGTKDDVPNAATLFASLLHSSGDSNSFEGVQLLLDITRGREGSGTSYYPVQINFPLIHDTILRDQLQGIGTNLIGLTESQLHAMHTGAQILLRQDPNFQRLQRDLQTDVGQ